MLEALGGRDGLSDREILGVAAEGMFGAAVQDGDDRDSRDARDEREGGGEPPPHPQPNPAPTHPHIMAERSLKDS